MKNREIKLKKPYQYKTNLQNVHKARLGSTGQPEDSHVNVFRGRRFVGFSQVEFDVESGECHGFVPHVIPNGPLRTVVHWLTRRDDDRGICPECSVGEE